MKQLAASWVWRVAWRDGRHSFGKLLRSMSCVIIGVASLVAAMSFRDNLASSVREQSKSLLGADLAIGGREPFSPQAEALIASLGGDQSRQVSFSSMAYFPGNGASRLVQVRAVSGHFPYYGALETEPASARSEFDHAPAALVDEKVMLQFGARVGDRVRVGERDFRIAGKLKKIPGENLAFSLISPRVYIPLADLDPTLLQKGSLVRYQVYFKFSSPLDVDALVERLSPQIEQLRLRADTVKTRAAAIERSLDNLARYLGLAVFVAVLLAGVGVASGAYAYAKEKTASAALLRCIGASPGAPVAVYVIQIFLVGAGGTALGGMLGMVLQAWLPIVLRDFLPVKMLVALTPKAMAAGMIVGLGTALLFALLALLPLRHVSPLLALRGAYEERRSARDPLLWLIGCIIVGAIFGFAAITAERWFHAIWFTAGVSVAFAFIAFAARIGAVMTKRLLSDFLPFAWRQGLTNLHRPNNQTVALMLAAGLAAFLLVTLANVQSMLLKEVADRGGKGEPNLVLFDVQKDQRAGIAALLRSSGVRAYEEVPIVTLRLAAVKGKRVEDIRAAAEPIPAWALTREYRSTYRERLAETEQLVQGVWRIRVAPGAGPIPISLEKGIAETLRVGLGDLLEFELQGVPLTVQVASIRVVDWQRVRPNFFVVFPAGVLEQAPQFYAVVTRAESAELSARLQRAVAETFPSVSLIDLTLILDTLDAILGRAERAIRFVALFTILTGLAMLASAIAAGRGQRITESVLLRALGAPKGQILTIVATEYLFLGACSALAGALLASLASWGLSFYFLGTAARFALTPVLWVLLLTTATVLLFGALGCWGIFRRPPLEALRAQA